MNAILEFILKIIEFIKSLFVKSPEPEGKPETKPEEKPEDKPETKPDPEPEPEPEYPLVEIIRVSGKLDAGYVGEETDPVIIDNTGMMMVAVRPNVDYLVWTIFKVYFNGSLVKSVNTNVSAEKFKELALAFSSSSADGWPKGDFKAKIVATHGDTGKEIDTHEFNVRVV